MTAQEAFEIEPVAHASGGRTEPTDDYWGSARSLIRIDCTLLAPEATKGLGEFSYLEVVFGFHLTDRGGLNPGARPPRDNPDWPEVGICRHNWLGVSRCRLLAVEGLDLHVEELDAVDGTPVFDIKPWFTEFGPRGLVHQAPWTTQMLADYFAVADEQG